MALTRDFRTTVRERAQRDPAFRQALLEESIQCLLSGEVDIGRSILRDYVNATIGFDGLAERTGKSPKSLMRMLGSNGNPQAKNLFEIIELLQESEGVRLEVRAVG